MSENEERSILAAIEGMHSDIRAMKDEMSAMRRDLTRVQTALAGSEAEAIAIVRRLWDEGIASGDVGDADEVIDRISASIASRSPPVS